MVSILSFSGRIKSGKSISADLVVRFDSRFEKTSFAKILKDLFAKEAGISRDLLDDVLEKEKYRRQMQVFGDEKRAKNRYFFSIALANSLSPAGFYVVDDTRRIEELETLLKLGAKPYGVFASPEMRKERGWVSNRDVDNHMSETELGDLSAYSWACLGGGMIYNTGTESHLNQQVIKIVQRHFPYSFEDLKAKKG